MPTMKLSAIVAVAAAVLLVTAGAAMAAPGNAPADPVADGSGDGPGDAGPADDAAENASAAGAAASGDGVRGPPLDLPEPVPDRVAQIHDLIRQFISGDLAGSLGEAISGVTPDDGSATQSD